MTKGYLLKTDRIMHLNDPVQHTIKDNYPSVKYNGPEILAPIEHNEIVIHPIVLRKVACGGKIEEKIYYIEDEWISERIESLQRVNTNNEFKIKDMNNLIDKRTAIINSYNSLPWYKKLFKMSI